MAKGLTLLTGTRPSPPINGQPNLTDTYNAIVRQGIAQLDGDYTINNLTLGELADQSDEGTISQTGNTLRTLDVNGLFTFEAGYIFAGTVINANGGMLITGPAIKRINNSTSSTIPTAFVNNAGTADWVEGQMGSGLITLSTTNPQVRSQLNNLATGTFNATAGGERFVPLFNNFGTLNINPGAGQNIDFDALYNEGTINLQSGTAKLVLFPGVAPDLNPGTGTFNISAGTTLTVNSFHGDGNYAGDGDIIIGGTVQSANNGPGSGTFNIGGTTTINETAALANGSNTNLLVLSGSDPSQFLNGGYTGGSLLTGSITASGKITWEDGGYGGQATIHADDGVTFASASRHLLREQVVMNLKGDSVVNSGAAGIYLEDDAQLNIASDATLTFLGSSVIFSAKNPGTLNNAGTIDGTNGNVLVSTDAVNTGLIIAGGFGSNIDFRQHSSNVPLADRRGLDQQGGELRMLGGRIMNIETFTGGKLTGFNFNSNVRVGQLTVTAGTISPSMTTGPSDPVGTIYFDSLALQAGAIVEVDVAGTEFGEFDRLVVPVTTSVVSPYGDLTLGGTLVLRMANGFENSILETDTFTILEALEDATGVFANVLPGQRLFTADGKGSFVVNYGATNPFGANKVVLSNFQNIPEPMSLTAMLLGLCGLTRRRRV